MCQRSHGRKMNAVFSEQNLKTFDYTAWIPCLSGNLVFEFIRPSLGSNHINKTSKDNSDFYILYSEKDWKDKPTDLSGKASIVLLAERKENHLEGRILIAPKEKAASPWTKKINNGNLTSQLTLTSFRASLKEKDRASIYTVKFKVHHSGIILLGTQDLADDHSPETKETLLRQSFYYIKYSLHHHKHHPKSIDSITTIEKINKSNPQESAKRLVEQLTFSIIELKRHYSDLGYRKETRHHGLLAYTRSLVQIVKEHKLAGAEYCDSQNLYLSNFGDSFRAIQEERKGKKDKKNRAIVLSLQILSLILASFFAFSSISFNTGRAFLSLPDEKSKEIIFSYPDIYVDFFSSIENITWWFIFVFASIFCVYYSILGWPGKNRRDHAKSLFSNEMLSNKKILKNISLALFLIIIGTGTLVILNKHW